MQRIEMHKVVSEEMYCDDMQLYVSYHASETLMGAGLDTIRNHAHTRHSLCGYLGLPIPQDSPAAMSLSLYNTTSMAFPRRTW